MRAVLISRRDVPRGLSALRPSTGAMAAIGDEDLTFTAGEAAEALAEVGKGEADAASVVEATGGWVTGVLFEAWRSAEHVPGMGGEADPLHGYLSAQMLAELCPERPRLPDRDGGPARPSARRARRPSAAPTPASGSPRCARRTCRWRGRRAG